jgi:molecular chaperone DnaK
VYQTEKTLREQRANLPADDISAVESALNEGREALKGEDVAVMERARDQINQVAHKLAEAMYKQAAGSQPSGAEGQQTGGASGAHKRDGEVVDAEFEDVN